MEGSKTARYRALKASEVKPLQPSTTVTDYPLGNFMGKGYQNRYIKYILLAS